MGVSEWLVLLGGVAGIAWVNWYFFLAQRNGGSAAAAGSSGVQEVRIEVKGGYSPSTVKATTGSPVRLIFDRQETNGCSEEVVLGEFGIRKFLPAHQATTVEFTPESAGTYEFTCGMGMLRGRVIVE